VAAEPPLELLTVRVDQADGVCTVHLIGEVDLSTVGLLIRELERVDGEVVIDLAWLTFIDSTGIQALVSTHRRLERTGGTLTMCGASAHVRQVLTIVAIDDWLID
jgi:anti-anti-sigma factor